MIFLAPQLYIKRLLLITIQHCGRKTSDHLQHYAGKSLSHKPSVGKHLSLYQARI